MPIWPPAVHDTKSYACAPVKEPWLDIQVYLNHPKPPNTVLLAHEAQALNCPVYASSTFRYVLVPPSQSPSQFSIPHELVYPSEQLHYCLVG